MLKKAENTQYFLRKDLCEDIHSNSLHKFLFKHKVNSTGIKEDLISSFNKAVNEGIISVKDIDEFLDREIRYGHHRSIFYKDIASSDLTRLKNLKQEELIKLLAARGWKIPDNNIVNIYLPNTLTLCEFDFIEGKQIFFTFVQTINTLGKQTVKRENNFYFVTIDIEEAYISIRMRPRSNIVQVHAGEVSPKVKNSVFFHQILEEIKTIFSFDFIASTHFKTTLYKIGKELTEKSEEKWKKEVDKYSKEIKDFATVMESSLEGFDPSKFDLNFRLHRLLERALIQSNFKEIKTNRNGKKGYVQMFTFSDRSGGKIKSQTKEEERGIELAEIYYDTRDTIDKAKTFDTLWVYWFTSSAEKVVRTKLEATVDYYLVHFYKYLNKDDLDYVLSEIRTFKQI